MKSLFLLSSVLGIFLNANEIYYDESNTFLNAKQSKEFLQTYFYKPFNTMQQSVQKQAFQAVMLLDKMQERANSPKDALAFKDCFSIIPIDTNIIKDSKKEFIYNNQRLKLLADCQPHEFARLHLQSYPLTDETFAKYMGANMKEGKSLYNTFMNYYEGYLIAQKSQQEFNQLLDSSPYAKSTIALYAITGKFSIYYLPHTLTIKRDKKQQDLLECCIDSLLCYIYDSFDFSDEPYQPVGMWDYNEVRFKQYEAMQHLGLYKKHKFIDSLEEMSDMINKGYMINKYYIINQNYQDYQNHFKFGLDYRIFSKSAKVIEIKPNNYVNVKLEVL